MTNRNESRLPEQLDASDAPVPQSKQPVANQSVNIPNNLEFVSPTEFIDLPSEGKYYSEDHPLFQKDSIEIKFMTTKQEDILTSKSLIRKGVVIDRLLKSLIVDSNIKIEDLLIGDKNAITVGARINGYGAEYETKITCPSCQKVSKYEFDLSEIKLNKYNFEDSNGEDGISLTANKTVLIALPKTKWVVEVRFLTGEDENYLEELEKRKKKLKLPETPLTDQMKRYIVSINGIVIPEQINKAIDIMPSIDSKYLRKTYKDVVPNVDLNQVFTCEHCEIEQEVKVPFTAEFFWPER